MRRVILGMAALLLGTAAGSAPATHARLLPAPLLPLSMEDTSTGEFGCENAFAQGSDSFVFIRNSFLILRTAPGAAGRVVCHPDDAALSAFGDGTGSVTCGGRTLRLRVLAPIRDPHPNPEADGGASHAILTMSDGTHTRSVRGTWGTAC